MPTYELRSAPDGQAMSVALSLNAMSFLNQVSRAECQRIERALERLSRNYDTLSRSHVQQLEHAGVGQAHTLLSYRVARDVRVFFFVDEQVINVVEIIRKEQIDSLRALSAGVV